MPRCGPFRFVASLSALLFSFALHAEVVRVAAYNLENYLDQPTESRRVIKSPEARAKIRESIRAARPDVLALEEIGATNALLELRASLKTERLDFPFWEYVAGFDTNIHVAVLSRFPFTARRPHTRDNFLLDGRRFHVKRGFAEVDVKAGPNFSFTLIAAHLKSRLEGLEGNQAQERLEEARILRRIVDADLAANPNLNLIVLGDFNDVQYSAPVKELIGRGRFRLVDTRPAERNGDNAPNENPRYQPRRVTWTHYYGVEDSYARIDYILLSPAMARRWLKSETCIPTVPNWGAGSDHRPIVAGFEVENK